MSQPAAIPAPPTQGAPQPTPGIPPAPEPTMNETQRRLHELSQSIKLLPGSEKAAIVLLALADDAKPIWDRLDDDELREISSAMSNLGPVRADMLEYLIKDFVNRLSGSGAVTGSYDQTSKLLAQF